METAFIDKMEEFYAVLILVEGVEAHKAIFAMISTFPDAIGQDYLLVLCKVATVIEAEATQKSSVLRPLHTEVYKFAAILALDILELDRKGQGSQTGHALIAHWSQTDERLFI